LFSAEMEICCTPHQLAKGRYGNFSFSIRPVPVYTVWVVIQSFAPHFRALLSHNDAI